MLPRSWRHVQTCLAHKCTHLGFCKYHAAHTCTEGAWVRVEMEYLVPPSTRVQLRILWCGNRLVVQCCATTAFQLSQARKSKKNQQQKETDSPYLLKICFLEGLFEVLCKGAAGWWLCMATLSGLLAVQMCWGFRWTCCGTMMRFPCSGGHADLPLSRSCVCSCSNAR